MDSVKHHTKLAPAERDLIAVLLGGDVKIREIARRIRRSPGTICDEIGRNSFVQEGKRYYVAIKAQSESEKRQELSRKRHPLKDPSTYAYVLGKLEEGWSPEQIAGRLKRNNGNQTVICHETIYSFVYAKENQKLRLFEYLPWKRVRRRRKYGRSAHRERIPQRVSIHERPEEISQRIEFGHWEGDSIIGRRLSGGAIRTEVERVSRNTEGILLTSATAQETVAAQEKIFGPLPLEARRSTTVDNGLEHTLHLKLEGSLGIKTYFADPYSAWQRGTNEYHNGLIRRYLPKGSDFSELNQGDLDDILWEINNRPRKVLDFATPKEVYELNLKQSVRIQSRM
jgi:IS30 family transposase